MTDFPVIRDAQLAARAFANFIRWADAWSRGDRPPDLRNWILKDMGDELHERAAGLVAYARRLNSARYMQQRVVSIRKANSIVK